MTATQHPTPKVWLASRQSRLLKGFYDYLGGSVSSLDEMLVPTRMETLSLIPAGQASGYESAGERSPKADSRLRQLHRMLTDAGIDVCLIDTAAGLFGSTSDVLTMADAVLVPQQAEPLGIRSVPRMMEGLMRMRERNPQLLILGVLLTMMQEQIPECRETGKALRTLMPPEMVMTTVIPRGDLFVKASARGLPAGVMDGGEEALRLFERLRIEIDRKLEIVR